MLVIFLRLHVRKKIWTLSCHRIVLGTFWYLTIQPLTASLPGLLLNLTHPNSCCYSNSPWDLLLIPLCQSRSLIRLNFCASLLLFPSNTTVLSFLCFLWHSQTDFHSSYPSLAWYLLENPANFFLSTFFCTCPKQLTTNLNTNLPGKFILALSALYWCIPSCFTDIMPVLNSCA